MRNYTPNKDVFLSNCLGYPVCNYTLSDDLNIRERMMYQVKISANVDLNNKNKFLLDKGFKLITTNIHLEFIPTMDINIERKSDYDYLEEAQRHTDDILKIAIFSFTTNRYYSDPNISPLQACQIMEQWTYNCLYKERANHIFLQKDNDKVTGFLFSRVEEDKAIIDLLAVDKNYRSKKIGCKLVEQFFLKYAWSKDIKKLQVGTQITNMAAIKTYQSMGFKVNGFEQVYHLHTGV